MSTVRYRLSQLSKNCIHFVLVTFSKEVYFKIPASSVTFCKETRITLDSQVKTVKRHQSKITRKFCSKGNTRCFAFQYIRHWWLYSWTNAGSQSWRWRFVECYIPHLSYEANLSSAGHINRFPVCSFFLFCRYNLRGRHCWRCSTYWL